MRAVAACVMLSLFVATIGKDIGDELKQNTLVLPHDEDERKESNDNSGTAAFTDRRTPGTDESPSEPAQSVQFQGALELNPTIAPDALPITQLTSNDGKGDSTAPATNADNLKEKDMVTDSSALSKGEVLPTAPDTGTPKAVKQSLAMPEQSTPTKSNKVIYFVFAGRKSDLEIQAAYWDSLLAAGVDEIHLWEFTDKVDDINYLRRLQGVFGDAKVKILDAQPKMSQVPRDWTMPYKHYAEDAAYGDDTVFLKGDDDDMYIDTERLPAFIQHVRASPTMITSANVVNNMVCQHLQKEKLKMPQWNTFEMAYPPGGFQGSIFKDAALFEAVHHEFLKDPLLMRPPSDAPTTLKVPERISINFIAYMGHSRQRVYEMVESAKGEDELALTTNVNKAEPGQVEVYTPLIVAHLSFGPQVKNFEASVQSVREKYLMLAKQNHPEFYTKVD